MKQERLKLLIKELLKEELKDSKTLVDEALYVGYNPLEKIKGALFHWVAVPFNGQNIICNLRCPNATQIEQCGNISNIVPEEDDDKKSDEIDYDRIIKIRNYQEALCKLVFNIPTFDNIASLMNIDFVISDKKKELAEITGYYEENKKKLSISEQNAIDIKIRTLDLQLGFFLPDDTMAFITKWAMGNDISDIKKLNRDMFLRAALIADRYKKAPSDYISGIYTDYNKTEIDAYAISILNDFKQQKQVESDSKHNWILGGRSKNAGEFLSGKSGRN